MRLRRSISRFSLRAFLLFVLAIAGSLSWQAHQHQRERAAILAIEDLGGHLETAARRPEWLWGRLGSQHAVVAKSVQLNEYKLHPAMQHLKMLEQLQRLNISANGTSLEAEDEIDVLEEHCRSELPGVLVQTWAPICTINVIEHEAAYGQSNTEELAGGDSSLTADNR